MTAISVIVMPLRAQTDPVMSKFIMISPVVSTRADVERLFGVGEAKDLVVYRLENYRVWIQYSNGTCTEDWLTPKGTVVTATIYFYNVVKPLKELTDSVNLSRLKVRKSLDVEGEKYYFDDKAGRRYDVNEAQMEWISIELYPPKKYSKLRC